MGEKLRRILSKVATSTSLLGSFTCRKFTTWDQRLYFPSEGRRAEDFFARKIRWLRPGLNPRTRVPKASTLTSRPPKPLSYKLIEVKLKVLCYINKTWRNLCNVVCSLWKVEGNRQHLPTAMVLIVGILATMFLCYHFHTGYSFQTTHCRIFSCRLDCYANT